MSVDRLSAAGFHVLPMPAVETSIPSESAAWKPVVSSLARPDWRVSNSLDDALEQLEKQWRQLLSESGLVGEDGSLLISLTRQDVNEGWSYVRLPEGPLNLDALGPTAGEPEFVAMSLAGDVVCGVTAEEYELWIVCARLK